MAGSRHLQAGCSAAAKPMPTAQPHGGNLTAAAAQLGCGPAQLLDASASLVPFGPSLQLRWQLVSAALGLAPRIYPDRSLSALRGAIAAHHGLDPQWVLPGNGAAELFTWAARDAARAGVSVLPVPGFADYPRALACWGGAWIPQPLPLHWGESFPQQLPPPPPGAALWLTNPHNPTGQLWSRQSLEPLLQRYALVICDEAFLPLSLSGAEHNFSAEHQFSGERHHSAAHQYSGERQSLVPLLAEHPNLVVIRSLTKLHAIAGLRIGYALAHPDRLRRWAGWRDPWPVNGLAAAVAEKLIAPGPSQRRWQRRVHRWLAQEGPWLRRAMGRLEGLEPLPSATNFLLVRGVTGDGAPRSLQALRQRLEQRHRILLRDCRSFEGLDDSWLRIGLQDRRRHRQLLRALELAQAGG